jgi:hypothetical protein
MWSGSPFGFGGTAGHGVEHMTEHISERERAPEAAGKGSRGFAAFRKGLRAAIGAAGPVDLAVLVLGLAAGLLMIATEFTDIFSVQVLTATCEDLADPNLADRCVSTGGEQHAYAFLVLGLFALVMAWGAGIGHSRPAALALVAAGVGVLLIAILLDLPDTNKTGALGVNFSEAEAHKGTGFWLELVAGALALLAGTFRLTRAGPRPDD